MGGMGEDIIFQLCVAVPVQVFESFTGGAGRRGKNREKKVSVLCLSFDGLSEL